MGYWEELWWLPGAQCFKTTYMVLLSIKALSAESNEITALFKEVLMSQGRTIICFSALKLFTAWIDEWIAEIDLCCFMLFFLSPSHILLRPHIHTHLHTHSHLDRHKRKRFLFAIKYTIYFNHDYSCKQKIIFVTSVTSGDNAHIITDTTATHTHTKHITWKIYMKTN